MAVRDELETLRRSRSTVVLEGTTTELIAHDDHIRRLERHGIPGPRTGVFDDFEAAGYLASLPYVDGDRIGIWGWSYGGYNTLLAMSKYDGPETFKVGIAVAPGAGWDLYDTIYTERYLSTPQKNPRGYAEGNPVNFVDRLEDDQRLLIVQGDLDDNVHFQNTIHLISALQAANRQFDLMIYPGGNHGMAGTGNPYTYLHLYTKMTDFLTRNL